MGVIESLAMFDTFYWHIPLALAMWWMAKLLIQSAVKNTNWNSPVTFVLLACASLEATGEKKSKNKYLSVLQVEKQSLFQCAAPLDIYMYI